MPKPLNKEEIKLLEQLLWFFANLLGENKGRAFAFNEKLDFYLGGMIKDYHAQFDADLWKITVWCMSQFSMILEFQDFTRCLVFNDFIHNYGSSIVSICRSNF